MPRQTRLLPPAARRDPFMLHVTIGGVVEHPRQRPRAQAGLVTGAPDSFQEGQGAC